MYFLCYHCFLYIIPHVLKGFHLITLCHINILPHAIPSHPISSHFHLHDWNLFVSKIFVFDEILTQRGIPDFCSCNICCFLYYIVQEYRKGAKSQFLVESSKKGWEKDKRLWNLNHHIPHLGLNPNIVYNEYWRTVIKWRLNDERALCTGNVAKNKYNNSSWLEVFSYNNWSILIKNYIACISLMFCFCREEDKYFQTCCMLHTCVEWLCGVISTCILVWKLHSTFLAYYRVSQNLTQ